VACLAVIPRCSQPQEPVDGDVAMGTDSIARLDIDSTGVSSGKTVIKGNSTKSRSLLLWATVATLALNFVPSQYSIVLLYPLRIFVTFFHESGHAMAAILTGGHVDYLQVFSNGEGVTYGRPPFWALWLFDSGGYIGTTISGAVLLQFASRSRWKLTLNGIGAYILVVTLLWAHNPIDNLFTLSAGVIMAAAMFAAAQFCSQAVSGFLVTFLAVQLCLNALGDLRMLFAITTATSGPIRDNDAAFMSQNYALPPVFWAVTWAGISVVILAISLRSYFRATARQGPIAK